MMTSLSNNLNQCDTLGKGGDWAIATERELTMLATMLLGRRPVSFGAIWRDLRVINHEYGKFKP
jgi:hypothetical protein